jgi:hypothetical protein
MARAGVEQDVHRRPVMVDPLARMDTDEGLPARAPDFHLEISGSKQRMASQHAVSVLRFADPDPAHRVEPLGKGGGETGRHVLHRHHARRVGRQAAEEHAQSLRAAGG